MKPRNILGFIAGLATFAFAYGCHAASGQSTSISNTQNSEVHNSSQGASQTELAREWGLTPQEWSRFQTVMEGPRGIYSPGLDPLTALGIEAKSEEERRRYAELQVRAERQRIDKELRTKGPMTKPSHVFTPMKKSSNYRPTLHLLLARER